VVFAGFSAQALADRIINANAKFLITADQVRYILSLLLLSRPLFVENHCETPWAGRLKSRKVERRSCR
jgi:hypothetical protein